VNSVTHKAAARGLAKRPTDLGHKHLSIDEKAVKKGHKYISILSDEQTGITIGATAGRTKESVEKLRTSALTEHQRSKVETICTDTWDAYIYGAKTYFPAAKHCHDNFHLVDYLNKAVDKVRRREVKQHEALKNTKYIYLKDHMNLSEKQRIKFESIKDANYEVSKAWRIKENFRDIQFKQTNDEAFIIYMRCRQDAMAAKIAEVTEVVEMFDRHLKGIINAIETGANNARAERLNGAIQELDL